MNEEINKIYNSLPEEEKEKLNKFEKKGIAKITQKVDQQTGEILSTETNYNSETKRKKGTFGIISPEELEKLFIRDKNRAINKMMPYILYSINYNNEFSFTKEFIENYNILKSRFYSDRKYLLDNNYIFQTQSKNIYTLNVNIFFRGTVSQAAKLYEEQFETELNQDIEQELIKIKKKAFKLPKKDIENLIKDLQNLL